MAKGTESIESTKSVKRTGERAEINRMTVDRGLKEAAMEAASQQQRRLGQRRATSLTEYVQAALLRQLQADGYNIDDYIV